MEQRRLALVGMLVLVLASGCGGGSGGAPGVANLGATGATTSSRGGAAAGSGSSAASAGGGGQAIMIGGAGLTFSRCMRAHGVANFPDPNGQGLAQFGPDSGIDPQSPSFQAAAQTCQNALRSKELTLSPSEQLKSQREALAFSACVRRHGIPDFPDPHFGADGNAAIRLAGTSSGDLNPNDPTLQSALQACRGYKLGSKNAPGSFSAGGPK